MMIVPANQAFVSVIHSACAATGRDQMPTHSIAIVPQSRGKVAVRLVQVVADCDLRYSEIIEGAESVRESVRAAERSTRGVFCLLLELLEWPRCRWTIVSPTTLQPCRLGGVVHSAEFRLII